MSYGRSCLRKNGDYTKLLALAAVDSRPENLGGGLILMAEWTGLEPATPGVTGRYSNQLNYHSADWPVSIDMRASPVFTTAGYSRKLEREKSLELSTYTLARYRSTN